MKKKLLICTMIICSLLLTVGCKKQEQQNTNGEQKENEIVTKELSCSYEGKNDSNSFTFVYENNNIVETTFVTKNKYDSEKKAKAQYDNSKKDVQKYGAMGGIETKITLDKDTITSSITFIIKELDKDAKSVYDDVFNELSSLSYDQVKNNLIEAKYTCEEK